MPQSDSISTRNVNAAHLGGTEEFDAIVAGNRVFFRCHWKLNGQPKAVQDLDPDDNVNRSLQPPCRTLDLVLIAISVMPQYGKAASGLSSSAGDENRGIGGFLWGPPDAAAAAAVDSAARRFIRAAVDRNIAQYASSITAVKLVLPTVDGYALRNDLVQRRLLTCDLVEEAADFTSTGREIHAFDWDEGGGTRVIIPRALDGAVGAVLQKQLPSMQLQLVEYTLSLLEAEVAGRLSFPWISRSPLPRFRLAVVEARPNEMVAATAGMGMYRAARALGIDLVILERDHGWARKLAATEEGGGVSVEFVPCDLTQDDGLPDRIVEALSHGRRPAVDGITTFNDYYTHVTALVAEKMGLPTNPSQSIHLCRDKAKMRQAVCPDTQVLSVQGLADLRQTLSGLKTPLQYPLIVKPAIGCASEGVTRVSSEADLFMAVDRIEHKFPGTSSLLEPYASGPEVDVNLMFLDGKLIWGEVVDDFPTSAEVDEVAGHNASGAPKSNRGAGAGAEPQTPSSSISFAETSDILPSILPSDEVDLLKRDLAEKLKRLGIRNGLFHLEARVENSKARFAMTHRGVEVVPREDSTSTGNEPDPSVFLIEINARIPGHQESYSVEYTYGIDYYALQLLAALVPPGEGESAARDVVKTHIRALSRPLQPNSQFPTHIVFSVATRGGTFLGADPLPASLARWITNSKVYKNVGDVIGDPSVEGKWPFLAYFGVTGRWPGRDGREQARGLGELVRETFTCSVE
ncbi:Alanine--anticapsin ligase [Colletotrichum tanaceti]|uniref:Alanine--anticapsin ligase n=1 Tax=Colletotrichum tanaceti TaxID=1306861 RepID=A0A4U6XL95_9PEZI|nr:Alanine--anticapsin ligase [Colletotrichum tanaceti]TKW56384.1 Alanine--anticapsin ligase [Colletotrichum tanaceti]